MSLACKNPPVVLLCLSSVSKAFWNFVLFTCSVTHLKFFFGLNFFNLIFYFYQSNILWLKKSEIKKKKSKLEGLEEASLFPISPPRLKVLSVRGSASNSLRGLCVNLCSTISVFQSNSLLFLYVFDLSLCRLPPKEDVNLTHSNPIHTHFPSSPLLTHFC